MIPTPMKNRRCSPRSRGRGARVLDTIDAAESYHHEGSLGGKWQKPSARRHAEHAAAERVVQIPANCFSDERFVVRLLGKHLNAADGSSSASAIASDAFKAIVTGEPVAARDVYAPAITIRPEALHLFATNDLPAFRGGIDRGVQRRLLILQFNRTIPLAERVEGIGRRIGEQEGDLLLRFAVEGAKRLLRQRRFTEPPSSTQALRDWLTSADPIHAWLEFIGLDPDARTRTRDAYQHFRDWATVEGYRAEMLPAVNTFASGSRPLPPASESSSPNNVSTLAGIRLPKASRLPSGPVIGSLGRLGVLGYRAIFRH